MISSNIVWQNHIITKEERSVLKAQKPCILWFTGLSGSGKSTIANALENRLQKLERHTYLLDGDNIRHGLNRDLGFGDKDRIENIRRIGEVGKLFVDAGLIVITAFISPFGEDRKRIRDLVSADEFIEVFIDTPLATCQQRDPKGLYKKVQRGEIVQFTGISSPYEKPSTPEIHIETEKKSIEESVDLIVNYLIEKKIISSQLS